MEHLLTLISYCCSNSMSKEYKLCSYLIIKVLKTLINVCYIDYHITLIINLKLFIMTETTSAWRFENLDATAKAAYIKMAKDNKCVVNPDNGRIMEVPETISEFTKEVEAKVIDIFTQSELVNGKLETLAILTLDKPIPYLVPETIEFGETTRVRVNGGLENFLVDCDADVLLDVPSKYRGRLLRQIIGTEVSVTVRCNKNGVDGFGVAYGYSTVPKTTIIEPSSRLDNLDDAIDKIVSRATSVKALADLDAIEEL